MIQIMIPIAKSNKALKAKRKLLFEGIQSIGQSVKKSYLKLRRLNKKSLKLNKISQT
jgi:hypothetical protein